MGNSFKTSRQLLSSRKRIKLLMRSTLLQRHWFRLSSGALFWTGLGIVVLSIMVLNFSHIIDVQPMPAGTSLLTVVTILDDIRIFGILIGAIAVVTSSFMPLPPSWS